MDPIIGGALIQTGGSLLSSAGGHSEAHENRKFQEYMSSTAHQREAKDLKAAGLNPILSVMGGSGAAQPSGAMFTPENPLQGAAAAGIAMSQRKIEKGVAESQIEKNASESAKAFEEAKESQSRQNVNSAQEAKINAETGLIAQQIEGFPESVKKEIAQASASSAQAIYLKKQVENLQEDIKRARVQYPQEKATGELWDPEKHPFAARFLPYWNAIVSPLIHSAGQATGIMRDISIAKRKNYIEK